MKLLIGWYRLFVWKLCPQCNSDAPEKDTCEVCKMGARRHYPEDLDKKTQQEWWVRFKEKVENE